MAAPPLKAYLSRPPKRARTLENTTLSKKECCRSSSALVFFCAASSLRWRTTSRPRRNMARLRGDSLAMRFCRPS